MDHAYQAYEQYIQTHSLKPDTTPQELEAELNRFWDSVMLRVTQATTDTRIRTAYRLLLRQARTQGQLLQWLGEPEVFYSTSGADKGKRKIPWLGIAGAVVLAVLAVWFGVPHEGSNLYVTAAAGGALLLTALQTWLLWSAVPAVPSVKIRTEPRIAPDLVRAGLQKQVRELDAHAEGLCAMLDEEAPRTSDPELTLAQELLRLPKDRRDPAVMDAVERYLVRQGVEMVEYSQEHQALFMVLPGPCEMTVEPALVRDGQLLHMGVACVPMEG